MSGPRNEEYQEVSATRDRLYALRHKWLSWLEAEEERKPNLEHGGVRLEWTQDRLILMQCIREATLTLKELPLKPGESPFTAKR